MEPRGATELLHTKGQAAMSSIQSKFVQVGDLRVHYLGVGDDVDLPPLVFLPSAP